MIYKEMYTAMRKKIAIILFGAMLISTMSGCGNAGSDDDTVPSTAGDPEQTSAESEETRKQADLPDVAFDGYEFHFLHWQTTYSVDISAEEATGDALNDAVYERNRGVEEKYNVKLSAEYLPATNIVTNFRASVMANDNAYDAVFPQAYYASGAITDELYLDLYQLPYVDFSDPWWDQGSVETLSTGDKLFMVNSDFTLSDKNSTGCILFNKKLQEENGIEDLYGLVNEGKWTLDKLTLLSENVSADLDGNSIYDQEDRYGIVASAGFSYQLLHGANCWYVSKDSDGIPQLSFNNERTISIAQRIMSIFEKTEVLYNTHITSTPDETRINMFLENKGLFSNTNLGAVFSLRNMEADFGILPIPKYDEEQERYYSFSSVYSGGIMMVPKTADNLERTAVVLTALASGSEGVYKAYYERALKGKVARDEGAADMIDILFSTRCYDWGEFLAIGGFPGEFVYLTLKNNKNVSTLYAQYESKMLSDLEKINSLFGE